MAVNPQILAAIADPTGGKLSEIGSSYMKSRQNAIDNERNAEKDKITKTLADQSTEKYEFDKMDRGSKAVLGLADDAIGWYETYTSSNGKPPTDEEFKAFQDEQYTKAPDVLKPYAMEQFQTIDQYKKGKSTATSLQEYLHPVEAKAFKPDYEVGLAIDKNDPTKKNYARTRDGLAEVQVKGGKWRALDTDNELFLRGDATLTKDQLGGLSDSSPDLKLFPEDEDVVKASDESATIAATQLPRIDLSLDMYRKGLVEGGAFTGFMAEAKNYYKSVTGLDWTGGDDMNSVVVMTATAKDAQLAKTMDLKGAISDKEQILAEKASGISIDNPKQGAMLNLKIIKMANLRSADYNSEMRSYLAKQRSEDKKPSLDNFPATYAAKTEKLPGIVSKTEKVEGRDKVQYLFHWEQKEKELAAVRTKLANEEMSFEDKKKILDAIGSKFDDNWANKYGR